MYELKVSEVMSYYGLFIVEINNAMPFKVAEKEGLVRGENLTEQYEDTSKDENFCIFGTLHHSVTDN